MNGLDRTEPEAAVAAVEDGDERRHFHVRGTGGLNEADK